MSKQAHVHPNDAALAALAGSSSTEPIVMLNMLRFRERAAYLDGSGHGACSGREAYQRYGVRALEHVRAVGGKALFRGAAQLTLIGPQDEPWDEVLLVQYPSPQAFMTMISHPDYLACSVHRTAALEDSRLIALRP
jgi:uncharacterized protein (DUF1330 family)